MKTTEEVLTKIALGSTMFVARKSLPLSFGDLEELARWFHGSSKERADPLLLNVGYKVRLMTGQHKVRLQRMVRVLKATNRLKEVNARWLAQFDDLDELEREVGST